MALASSASIARSRSPRSLKTPTISNLVVPSIPTFPCRSRRAWRRAPCRGRAARARGSARGPRSRCRGTRARGQSRRRRSRTWWCRPSLPFPAGPVGRGVRRHAGAVQHALVGLLAAPALGVEELERAADPLPDVGGRALLALLAQIAPPALEQRALALRWQLGVTRDLVRVGEPGRRILGLVHGSSPFQQGAQAGEPAPIGAGSLGPSFSAGVGELSRPSHVIGTLSGGRSAIRPREGETNVANG